MIFNEQNYFCGWMTEAVKNASNEIFELMSK